MKKSIINLETGEQIIVDMTEEEIAEHLAAAAVTAAEQAAYVPQSVPMWTVRVVLQNNGMLEQAQAIIDASENNALKAIWEYGNFAERNSPTMLSLASALGISEEQLDQLFRDAGNLQI
jgi:AraC-like DNA-binding protein